MNDPNAARLIDELRTVNRHLTDINEALRERHPYKPLLIHTTGDMRIDDFEAFKAYLDKYFEELEKKPDV